MLTGVEKMAIQDFYFGFVYESGDVVVTTESRNGDPEHLASVACHAARIFDGLSIPCPEPETPDVTAKSAKSGSK